MNKKYRTRDGREVRLLCTDSGNPNLPVVALVGTKHDCFPQMYFRGGTVSIKGRFDPLDLVEVQVELNGSKIGFDTLPDSGYVRQAQLIPDVVPFSGPTLWRKVKAGKFPAPVKLSEQVTAWRVKDVRAWLANPIAWGAKK